MPPLKNLSTHSLPTAINLPGTKLSSNPFEGDDLVQVTPNIAQSKEDFEANKGYDEAQDNFVADKENINP